MTKDVKKFKSIIFILWTIGFRGRVVGMGTLDQWVRGSNPDARLISKGCVEPLK